MNIADYRGNGKQILGFLRRDDVYISLVIVLVGLAGFGLGRLSKVYDERPPVRIEEAFPEASMGAGEGGPALSEVEGSVLPASVQESGSLVGSKNSNKYHFPWCSGAQSISEANKIWFASREEAEGAGYIPAKNCKGL